MSVAFRRESDEEHLEPKFELPLPPGPNPVTARGLAQIEAKVADFEAAVAAATEDDPRKAANRDLRYWRSRLASAQLAPAPSGAIVAFGTTVTIEQNETTRTLHLGGHDEGDPATGHIAFAAPLARALIGNEIGDEIEAADGPITIIAIETPESR